MIPIISVRFDFDSGEYVLYATSYGITAPAGCRLARGGELPSVAFRHAFEADAERDAKALQEYLNREYKVPGKRNKKNVEERA